MITLLARTLPVVGTRAHGTRQTLAAQLQLAVVGGAPSDWPLLTLGELLPALLFLPSCISH